MDFIATQKFILLSPRKVRPVVAVIKKMKPTEAVEKLPYVGKLASEPLAKVIKTAIANARNKGISEADLIFKEIQIGEGPRLKRGQPVSRGQWHPIIKRMSHIRVVLTTKSNKQEALKIKDRKVVDDKEKNTVTIMKGAKKNVAKN